MTRSSRKYSNYLVAVIVLIFSVSCKHNTIKPDRAFYYWRNGFSLSNKDVAYLKDGGVTKLYLHFFDVGWNAEYQRVIPVDEIKIDSNADNMFQYIPVVYIANKALEETAFDSIDKLSRHINAEIKHVAEVHKIIYKELQFDCDWTDGTQKKYFKILSYFHKELKKSGIILSSTIRLHQVKYAEKTGIPPVDRGMLMFYNMGKINAIAGYNSIYNERDANNYASYVKTYALPLDVALPVFGWAVCIHDGKVTGLIEKAVDADFADTALFMSGGKGIFVSRKAFFLHGRYFMKSDSVKMERISPDICEDAAANINKYLTNEKRTVSLFDYDSLYLSTYEKKDLEKIFALSN